MNHQSGQDFTFWLGSSEPSWLSLTEVPLFISARRLRRRKKLRRSSTPLAVDSGGFTELGLHGRYETSARQYAAEVQRWSEQTGNLAWAACQDWMCEPSKLEKTGGTVLVHQHLTTENYLTLLYLAPHLPWVPVLQGQSPEDYLLHVLRYQSEGVDLASLPLVGVGTLCRRNAVKEIAVILESIRSFLPGIRLHGFGLKLSALKEVKRHLVSADSMAWSYRARRCEPLAGHTHLHCNNCLDFALAWRQRVLGIAGRPQQHDLFDSLT